MTEPKSSCCGADVIDTGKADAIARMAGMFPFFGYDYKCSKCHKPCKVKEERDGRP